MMNKKKKMTKLIQICQFHFKNCAQLPWWVQSGLWQVARLTGCLAADVQNLLTVTNTHSLLSPNSGSPTGRRYSRLKDEQKDENQMLLDELETFSAANHTQEVDSVLKHTVLPPDQLKQLSSVRPPAFCFKYRWSTNWIFKTAVQAGR